VSLELTDEERALVERWQTYAEHGSDLRIALSAIYKLQAGKMKAEFYKEHEYLGPVPTDDAVCSTCWLTREDGTDPRHTWTDEQWLEAAKEHFSKEGK